MWYSVSKRPHFSCYGSCVLNSFVVGSNPIKDATVDAVSVMVRECPNGL
ncbi:hypothetical protein HMPREF1399_01618 [Helicobacter pylori GAM118Bi]|nr:hypothetical protein HMPREF1399_01618 [Helicobacter pylori GAM118Bi]